MAMPRLFLASPLRGEVGAQRRVRGSAFRLNTAPVPPAEPLTPTLSPEGRGGDRAAISGEALYGNA